MLVAPGNRRYSGCEEDMHTLPILIFVAAAITLVGLSWYPRWTSRHREAKDARLSLGISNLRPPISVPLSAPPSGGFTQLLRSLNEPKGSASSGPGTFTQMFSTGHQEKAAAEAAKRREAAQLKIKSDQRIQWIRLAMQIVTSLAVLGGTLYIIISPSYDPKDKHWAYGSAGTILGYWLRH